jgi:hypothetical protein
MEFLEYSDIGFRAFVFSNKQQEITSRKQGILKSVYDHHGVVPQSVLFVGFNPAILECSASRIYVTEISNAAEDWLRANNVEFETLLAEDLFNYGKQFDAVVALEEYFTFAQSETDQKSMFDMICNVTKRVMITTLRDYKNQEFKDREFSMPAVIRNELESRIYLEHHDYNDVDRNAWSRTVYEITGEVLAVSSCFRCRHMFFKQCAKFGYDAGARDFLVHKNLLYKSLIKKNYEHVISIKFG